MNEKDSKRISRLIDIVKLLQAKRLLTAQQLAKQFGVTVRTIQRDIIALGQAAVPVLEEEGKGYSLAEGYRMPPVNFTEGEAAAIVAAAKVLARTRDKALRSDYAAAAKKVQAVLQTTAQEQSGILSNRIALAPATAPATAPAPTPAPTPTTAPALAPALPRPADPMTLLQGAIASSRVLQITYHAAYNDGIADRPVEPFAIYYGRNEGWLLIAWCRLRQDFRMFRLDRILRVSVLKDQFKPQGITLSEYLGLDEKLFAEPEGDDASA